jgi:putative nucleotidyltransferase with HDIG domain
MTNMKKNFIPVSPGFIYSFHEALPFDVFLERSDDKFTAIYKKNSTYDKDQIARYQSKNVMHFYVSKSDTFELENFIVNLRVLESFDKNQAVEIFKFSFELFFSQLKFEDHLLQENLDLATFNVKNSMKLLENDPHLAMEIFKAISIDSQLLKHSYMVSLFSIILAKKLGMISNRILLQIGLGALLHDIGQTRINQEIFNKINLTPAEWETIKDHPQLGLKILDHSKSINSAVRSIIIQHHEQFNGRGYPNRLHNNQIFPPAKVVSIADGFCSIVSQTSYRKSDKTPEEAIEIMLDDLGHYDPEMLEVFKSIVLQKKN